ncbi:MAG: metalloregulator ArsR/SmtB family transcription factor [Deltaproteobacteria bacterium]|nr:metalloregulator ArsR/SmtB family transcription factor [Deltaproteobacteria bacterium]
MPPSPSPRQFKDAAYAQLARIGKSLASGPRLEILDLLCQGPRTVEVLAGQVGQSVANTSHHLQVLRSARLVEAERGGVHVTYRLADERVEAFFRALRDLAESRLLEIAEVTRGFVEARGSMEPVDREVLVDRVRSGAVTVLDVRPPEEYRAGHLPGALSVPLADLERRLAEIPRDREVVAYCRGPYCVMAVEAVELLRARGFRAIRMEEGVPDWRARGLPVEVAAVEASS